MCSARSFYLPVSSLLRHDWTIPLFSSQTLKPRLTLVQPAQTSVTISLGRKEWNLMPGVKPLITDDYFINFYATVSVYICCRATWTCSRKVNRGHSLALKRHRLFWSAFNPCGDWFQHSKLAFYIKLPHLPSVLVCSLSLLCLLFAINILLEFSQVTIRKYKTRYNINHKIVPSTSGKRQGSQRDMA